MGDKLDALTIRILTARRASLVQQAEGLAAQRRAILWEAVELDKMLGNIKNNIPVEVGERDSISTGVNQYASQN